LENYFLAAASFGGAIIKNSTYSQYYTGRGAAYFHLGFSQSEYCSDFRMACNLGDCDNYNKFCK
jgi:hypothetical protein